jgi:hypothetical protein
VVFYVLVVVELCTETHDMASVSWCLKKGRANAMMKETAVITVRLMQH